MPTTTLPPGLGVPSERVLPSVSAADVLSPAAAEVPSPFLPPLHAQSAADTKSAVKPKRIFFFFIIFSSHLSVIFSHYSIVSYIVADFLKISILFSCFFSAPGAVLTHPVVFRYFLLSSCFCSRQTIKPPAAVKDAEGARLCCKMIVSSYSCTEN